MRFAAIFSQQSTFGSLSNFHLKLITSNGECENVASNTFDVEGVLHIHVSYLNIERVDSRNITCRNLTLAERFHHFFSNTLNMLECLENSGTNNYIIVCYINSDGFFFQNTIQPRSIDVIRLEIIKFQQLHQIFNRVTDVTTDFHLLQCENQGLAGGLTVGSLGEQVTELRISEFVDTTIGTNREISPNIRGGLELDAFD
mmetsp:Transcript_15166/g.24900  ORF Transcript_15166/g.24900 Transcript_15166/m.24900 type:complete len:200 (-) Transcript_15166:1591-2190(-)